MAWYIGQSLPMMAIAFLVGLLVGYLLWGRRYRRLEQAEAVRAVDPATVLPHRGAAAPAAAAAAPAAAVAAAGTDAEAEDEDAEADGTAEPDEDEAVEPVAEAAAEGTDDGRTDTEDDTEDNAEDDEADAADEEAVGNAADAAAGDDADQAAAEADQPVAEAAAADPTADPTAAEDAGDGDHGEDDVEPPTAEEIAAQAEPQSLFAAAGQPEPAAPAPVSTSDRLEQIEGIGPKIALALRTAGIRTFEDLAAADESTLRDALADANLRFAPSLTTWAQQARLLADGDHEGHATLTQQLVAGRAPKAQ